MALQNSSYDEVLSDSTPPPPRKKDPSILIFVAVLAAGALAVMLIPSLSAPFHKAFPSTTHPKMNPTVSVWVNQNSGTYYCSDSTFYGRPPGELKKQGEALTAGYQPALGEYCTEPQSVEIKEVTRNKRSSHPRSSSPPSHQTDRSARRR